MVSVKVVQQKRQAQPENPKKIKSKQNKPISRTEHLLVINLVNLVKVNHNVLNANLRLELGKKNGGKGGRGAGRVSKISTTTPTGHDRHLMITLASLRPCSLACKPGHPRPTIFWLAYLASEEKVLARLRHLAVHRRHHQDRAVHLGRTGDPVISGGGGDGV